MAGKPTYEELERRIQELERTELDSERAASAPMENEGLCRVMFEATCDYVFLKDRKLRYVLVNPAMERLFGRSSDELAGLTDADLFGAEVAEHIGEVDARVLRGETVEEEDTKPVNGKQRHFSVKKSPVLDSDGGVVGICGIARDVTERGRMQKALRQSKERNETILKNVQSGVFVIDASTHLIMDVNPAAEVMIGAKRDEIIGHVCHEFVCPWELGKCPITDKGQQVCNSETVLIRKDGGRRQIIKTVIPINMEGHSLLLETFMDITGRKAAEAEARVHQDRFKAFFSSVRDAIFVHPLRREGFAPFIEVNDIASQRYGYSRDEFLELTAADITKKSDAQTHAAPDHRNTLLEKKHLVFESVHIKKSGEEFPVEINSNIIEQKGQPVILAVVRDISERQRTEKAIRDSEKRYRTLFEKSTDAIFIVERETGRYIDANEAAVRLTGRDLAQLKQLTTKNITPNGYRERLTIAFESNAAKELGKVIYVRPDGERRVATLDVIPLDDMAVIGIARDITDDLEMEDHLRQAQKMEAIGTLAGGIAHDFNNILSGIFGYTQLLQVKMQKDSDMLAYLEPILKAANRAKDLVKQILTFSRQSVNELHPMEIQMAVKEALKLVESAVPSTITIRQRIQKDCGLVLADHTQIHQIIMNLCTNAYHSMEESGGELTVTLSEVELTADDLKDRTTDPGKYVKLSVADTGTGIDRDVVDRIFDPYFTTKENGKGTGLGLAVIHGIVKGHGGHIRVASELEKGTEFCIYLPAIKTEPEGAPPAVHSPIRKGNERILLVDDQKDVVDIERQMLEVLGYRVTSKTSSVDALDTFRENPFGFDLVITDMTMPNMTGDKLAGALNKIRSDIPIILCTGFSELVSKETSESLGIQGFLMKPVVMMDLSIMIRTLLDK